MLKLVFIEKQLCALRTPLNTGTVTLETKPVHCTPRAGSPGDNTGRQLPRVLSARVSEVQGSGRVFVKGLLPKEVQGNSKSN